MKQYLYILDSVVEQKEVKEKAQERDSEAPPQRTVSMHTSLLTLSQLISSLTIMSRRRKLEALRYKPDRAKG